MSTLFSDLIGHDFAKEHIAKLLILKKFPQVILFYGEDGVGKKTIALECAKSLLNQTHSTHLDLHLFAPQGKSGLHTVDSIREIIALSERSPFKASRSVFIIDDVERMLPSAANALLKTLEEPLPHAYYILLTHDIDKMLPTILSRTQKVQFFPLKQEEIVAFLENKNISAEKTAQIAMRSHGSISKALEELNDPESPLIECITKIFTLSVRKDYVEIAELLQKLQASIKEQDEEERTFKLYDKIFEEIFYLFRDMELIRTNAPISLSYHPNQIETLRQGISHYTYPLDKLLEQTLQAKEMLIYNVKISAVLEDLLMKTQRVF